MHRMCLQPMNSQQNSLCARSLIKKRENSIKWHFKEEWFGIEATRLIFLEAFNVKLELEILKSFVNTSSDM